MKTKMQHMNTYQPSAMELAEIEMLSHEPSVSFDIFAEHKRNQQDMTSSYITYV